MAAKVIRRFLFGFFLGGLLVLLMNGKAFSQNQEKLIRVAILKDVPSVTLSIHGKFKLIPFPKSGENDRSKSLKETKVVPSDDGFLIGREKFIVDRLKIIPKYDATIFVNGRRFRGEVEIIRKGQKGLTVVNAVELEDYIKGVLYHEVSNRWTMEALKVQAVSTRTYALYRMKTGKTQDYDLTDDIYSQVYGGRGSERYRTNMAVNRTKGLILAYRGQILPTYFHATCGGHTEDVSELWKENLPPLKGVACPFCRQSPHYCWKKNFRLKDIQDKLNAKGYNFGLLKDISVVESNPSGRIRLLKITTRDDKSVTISGKDFRNIIGPNLLKSNSYEIVMKGYFMDVVGRGWGHGVGMCQWGANFMSRERYQYDEILQYYYPGAELVDYRTVVNPGQL